MAFIRLKPLPRLRQDIQPMLELVAKLLGPIAAELAYGEGLQAHARAAEMRLDSVG